MGQGAGEKKKEAKKEPAARKTPRRAAKSNGKKLCGCGCGSEVSGKRLYVNDIHKQQAFRNRKKEEATT